MSAPSRLTVVVGEARFAVEIEEAPDGRTLVRLDGEPLEVDARLALPGGGSLLIGALSYAVDLTEDPGGLRVTVDGEAFQVRVEEPGRRARDPAGGAGAGGGQRLVAPMPGKVVAVLVAPGQRVEPGAGLIVLEAMKMENEFRATAGGVVAEVPVSPGQAVNAGDLLVAIA